MTLSGVKNKKIYISASISGVKYKRYHKYVAKLVEFLLGKELNVLDEHIKGNSIEEMVDIVKRKTGLNRLESKDPWKLTYQQDMEWIDEATHLIAFCDGASYGVGMEIMRALLKKELGKNETPALILVHVDNIDKLSPIIRGIPSEKYSATLKTYSDFDQIKTIVTDFLF